MNLSCSVCKADIPADRIGKKGYAAVTCSLECYAEFRKIKKRPVRGKRVSEQEFAYALRIRRAVRRGAKEITLQLQ